MKKNNKGFTLVELIVVLVILAILAAILTPALLGYIDRARAEKDYSTAQTYLEKGQKLLRLDYKNNLDNQTLEPIFMGLMMLGDIKSNYGYREEADSLFKSAIDVCGLISQKEEPCKPDIMKVTILYRATATPAAVLPVAVASSQNNAFFSAWKLRTKAISPVLYLPPERQASV